MESNEQNKLTSKIETLIDSRLTALGGSCGEGSSKKEKGLIYMDSSVEIVVGREL